MIALIVIAVLVVIIVIWGISVYNQFITSNERVANAMGQIAAQVESRWDALSNLIQATKNYQSHEFETLTQIVRERSGGVSREASVQEIEQDENAFTQALRSLNVVVEQYPDLKASTVYQQTMTSVNQYENNVREARMIYNDTVTRYNRLIKIFPNSIISRLMGFGEKAYFENTAEKSSMPMWE
ncbi:MAG: LemA family protein [Aerococcus sp.]|nr:LemA family protein [Aerococcus sp.]